MTNVQDFQEQSPPSAANETRADNESLKDLPPRESPLQRDNARSPSIASGLTHMSSSESSLGVRRRVSRSNTVKHAPNRPTWKPGAEPGIDTDKVDELQPHLNALHTTCDILVVDFSVDKIVSVDASNDNLHELLSAPRPDHMPCRWISVNGLSWDVIKILGNHYNLHRLAIEDLLSPHSRTKVDWYSDHAFILLTLQKLIQLHTHPEDPDRQCNCVQGDQQHVNEESKYRNSQPKDVRKWARQKGRQSSILPSFNNNIKESIPLDKEEGSVRQIRTLHRYESSLTPEYTAFMERNSALSAENQVVGIEQVAIFLLSNNTCISFFESSAADVEDPILERLKSTATILRRSGDASLIVQAIIDAIVDLAIPVKEAYNNARKELQIDVLTSPSTQVSRALHIFSEEIDILQNLFKPIVNLVNSLRDHNSQSPLVSTSATPTTTADSIKSPSRVSWHSMNNNDDMDRPLASKRAHTPTNVVVTPIAHVYFGDVLDHCLTIIQSLEQMDTSANNLSNLMFNTIGAKTNNFMMIIALVTVFFSPLTFLTGYFGMNFSRQDATQDHSDAFFWYVAVPTTIVFIALVGGVVIYRGIQTIFARLRMQRARKQGRARRKAGK